MLLRGRDRRAFDRRVKSRIPPVLWRFWEGRWGKAPLLVCVLVASVWIVPEAMAQVQGTDTEIVFTKTLTTADLNEKMPVNPVETLGDKIESRVRGLVGSITKNQNARNQGLLRLVQEGAPMDPRRAALLSAAGIPTETPATVDRTLALQQAVRAEAGKALAEEVQKSTPFLRELREGMTFKFDLRRFFSGSSGAPVREGRIRYGLMVKDIVPAGDGAKLASAGRHNQMTDTGVDEGMHEQMRYAGHADVVWTIGPMTEEGSRKLFSEAMVEPPPAKEPSLLAGRLPSPSFSTKFEPGNLSSYLTSNTDPHSKGARMVIAQDQDFYQYVYQSDVKGRKLSEDHAVKVPVAGAMTVGRRYNDQFEAYETSLCNILVDKRAPSLNVHYLDLQKKYKGDMRVAYNGHQVGMAVEMVPGWRPGDAVLENPGEKYSVDYMVRF